MQPLAKSGVIISLRQLGFGGGFFPQVSNDKHTYNAKNTGWQQPH